MKNILLAIFAMLSLSDASHAQEVEKKVSVKGGEHLVELALASQNRLDGFDDPYYANEPFLIYPIRGATDGTLTDFGVNAWTGDVWDTFECRRITSPELQKAQAAIKATFTKEELKEYDQLYQLKPDRGYDLEPCGSPP